MINELFAVSELPRVLSQEDPLRISVSINQFPEKWRASRVVLFHYSIAFTKIRTRCSYFEIPQTAYQARAEPLTAYFESISGEYIRIDALRVTVHLSKITTHAHERIFLRLFSKLSTRLKRPLIFPYLFSLQLRWFFSHALM